MSTYGSYRDDTAHALAGLLTTSATRPLDSEQVDRVLGCRDLLLASLQQQFQVATGAAGQGSLQLAGVEANPVSAFGAALSQLPKLGPQAAPTDVLASRPGDVAYAAAWRDAARASVLAADVLDTTHAWRADPTATWAAVADAAEAAWALSLLDGDVAALWRHHGAQQRTEVEASGLGLLARLTVNLARQGPFNLDLDRLTRPAVARIGPRPLSEFAQAVDGELRVARMLHQRGGVVPVKALGPLLVGQARIAAGIADAATGLQPPHAAKRVLEGHERDIAAALSGAARARAEALTGMAKARKGVADTLSGGEPIVWQTAEVLRALHRRPTPTDRAQAVAQLRHLHRLTDRQDAASKLLVAGILDAFARGEYLVPHPDRNQLQWRPCTPDIEPPLRAAAEDFEHVRRNAVLPRPPGTDRYRTPAPSSTRAPSPLLADALAAREPRRPPSPGMSTGQPLSP